MAASVSTTADTAVKSASSPPQSGSKALLWVLLLVLAVLFAYQRMASYKEQVLDQNYYRILYEIGNSFSIRLEQLKRLYLYDAPAGVIRAQFPSYSEITSNYLAAKDRLNSNLHFELLHNHLFVKDCRSTISAAGKQPEQITFNDCYPAVNNDKSKGADKAKAADKEQDKVQSDDTDGDKTPKYAAVPRAKVSQNDILLKPRGGFSLVLIADDKGHVLARSGEENAVSFSKLDYVLQALVQQQGFSLANLFKADTANDKNTGTITMPGVSRHVEVNLSYGRYRVYLYPLQLSDDFSKAAKAVDGLYMIGLLPEQSFAAQKHDIAGFKMMLLSVVSLLFLWTFLKVCLLPQHQAVPPWLISLCYLSGFAMFSLLVAALSVFFIEQTMLQQKTEVARQAATQLNQNISIQLKQAFIATKDKTAFFKAFAKAQQECLTQDLPACISEYFQCNVYRQNDKIEASAKTCRVEQLGGNYSVLAYPIADEANSWKFGLFQQSLLVSHDGKGALSSQAIAATNQHYLLNSTVVNNDGSSSWPSVNYAESNSTLRRFSLSHRQYFTRVKTNTGWTLQFSGGGDNARFENSYIERLLNIASGTRGTTISMPIEATSDQPLAGAVLIADVFLPALNVTAPPQQDFTFMVVDKVTGAILYHSDNERSLIENVFFAGPDAATVKDFIQRQNQTDVLNDHYHGRAGRFVKQDMAVPDWQLLVFFPAQSVVLYSLVWFVILSVVPFITLVLLWLVINCSRTNSGTVKQILRLPKWYRRRWLFLQLTLLLSLMCTACSYALVSGGFSVGQLLLWLVVGWLVTVSSSCLALSEKGRAIGPALANSNRIFCLLLLLCLPAIWYLAQVQSMPLQALQNYYWQWQQLEQAREQKELKQAALYLYPNAATQRQVPAAKLLQLDETFDTAASDAAAETPDAKPSQSQLRALPVLSSASGYAYFWQMIGAILYDFADGKYADNQQAIYTTTAAPLRYVLCYLLAMLFLLMLFVWYVERILGARLCLSSAALRQLSRLVQISAADKADSLNEKLSIQFKAVSLQGVDITAVLQVSAHQFQRELVQLLQLSRVLRKWQQDVLLMPSLKLHLEQASDGLLLVKLSDIEVSLEQRIYRDHLLELLQELKALVLADKLAGLTLESGFHSFQHLAVKDAFKSAERHDELDHAEYLIWSECLMDFKVTVPEHFRPDVDPALLNWEARWCPHVRMLLQHDGIMMPEKSATDSRPLLQRLFRGVPDEGDLLAVQSYMLCHADAFYRFKWENCTKDEQLALYNLALGHQLNPLNITLLQNLALNGLLRVHRGRLKLVNNSFQQFVLNAEPLHKLQALVHEGEAGVWQQHRVTFAAIILTLLVAVALTSGHSLHIIAVSIAGVLGTLVSVFSNANLLRSQFR